jgi:hypothetical protein
MYKYQTFPLRRLLKLSVLSIGDRSLYYSRPRYLRRVASGRVYVSHWQYYVLRCTKAADNTVDKVGRQIVTTRKIATRNRTHARQQTYHDRAIGCVQVMAVGEYVDCPVSRSSYKTETRKLAIALVRNVFNSRKVRSIFIAYTCIRMMRCLLNFRVCLSARTEKNREQNQKIVQWETCMAAWRLHCMQPAFPSNIYNNLQLYAT